MTRVLAIGPIEQAAIQAAVERARARPIPWAQLKDFVVSGDRSEVNLGDRKPGFERIQSENVLIPQGYRAAISFEEQPAGIMRHLSVSVDTPGRVPSMEAVKMIAKEFGFNFKTGTGWVEEFEPGHHAINLIEVAVENKTAEGLQ
jgi:hypothetical protein